MKVLKFGGTSLGSAERIKNIVNLIDFSQREMVVLSAMSGTTTNLVEICSFLQNHKRQQATQVLLKLKKKYKKEIDNLCKNDTIHKLASDFVSEQFSMIENYIDTDFSVEKEKTILSKGEILSTYLFNFYLQEIGMNSLLIPALEFMKTNSNGDPDYHYIQHKLNGVLTQNKEINTFITQGYICRNCADEVDNLKRGGSDYTASIIGAAIKAKEVQIWTDIDGFHNNDPRFVENTQSIEKLSFDEASELAYFGAKILHPMSVIPVKRENIPLKLKNTLAPQAFGTVISKKTQGEGVKAVAAKEGITAIKIKSGRMLLAYGFLKRIFEVFEKYKTSIDMITTSEVAVSLTIDDNTHLEFITDELREFGTIEVDKEQTIVCIVGQNICRDSKSLKIFNSFQDIPVRMISYGGSKHNISVLIDKVNKVKALKQLSKQLF